MLRLRTLPLILLVFLLAAPAQAEISSPNLQITLATGSRSGVYRPLGERLASLINGLPEDIWTATLTTGGSVENCRLMGTGKANAGLVLGPTLSQALEGSGSFGGNGPLPLAAAARLFSSPEQLVTLTNSEIRNLSDLKGRRVSVGCRGSGNYQLAQVILRSAGLDPEKDIHPVILRQNEAARALAAGEIDAAFFNIALPAAAVLEVSAFHPIRLIGLPRDIVGQVTGSVKGTSACVIPPGTYPGQDEAVPTVGAQNYLVVPAGQDRTIAYILVRTLTRNTETFCHVLPELGLLSPAAAYPSGFPVAEGALGFYARRGVLPKR